MRTPDERISGTLAGAAFRFSCDVPDLLGYARGHLGPLASGAAAGASGSAAPAVDAGLRWHEGLPPRRRPLSEAERESMERRDRDTYVGADTLCWFRVDDLRDLHLRFGWKDGRLRVGGDFYFRLGASALADRLQRLRQWRRLPFLRRRRFPTLLAYTVYYPCWWWLEETQDYHPIHAAGVETGAGVVLLAGASGVGKSTLATALAALPGSRMLSDSFVLHNGTEVRAVPEPILLDDWSRNWLGEDAAALRALEHPYMLDRSGFQFVGDKLAGAGSAALLVFPCRAPRPYVRRLEPRHAHRRLSAADMIINDLRRYWAFAAVVEQLVPRGLVARREQQIETLVGGVPCYEIGLTADMSRDAARAAVLELLPGSRSVAGGAGIWAG